MKRRQFLTALTAAGLAGAIPRHSAEGSARVIFDSDLQNTADQLPLTSAPGTLSGEMLYRNLGSTGERVSAIGLGGSHVAQMGVTETMTIRLIRSAIDRGLTFMDNSWDYNAGESEIRMGRRLAGRLGVEPRVFWFRARCVANYTTSHQRSFSSLP